MNDFYTESLEFFAENGVQLNIDQMQALQELAGALLAAGAAAAGGAAAGYAARKSKEAKEKKKKEKLDAAIAKREEELDAEFDKRTKRYSKYNTYKQAKNGKTVENRSDVSTFGFNPANYGDLLNRTH